MPQLPVFLRQKKLEKSAREYLKGLCETHPGGIPAVAAAVDRSTATLYDWFKGKTSPQMKTRWQLVKTLSITEKSLDTPPTIIENSDPDCRTGGADMRELSERVADQRERITDMRSRLDSADSRLTQDVKDLKDRGQQHEDHMVTEFRTHVKWAVKEFNDVALEIQKRMDQRFSREIGTIAKACWELHRSQKISEGTLKELENLRCFKKENNQK